MIGWVTIWEIIWSGGLPHLTGLPHLPGVPYLHVNRSIVMHFQGFISFWQRTDRKTCRLRRLCICCRCWRLLLGSALSSSSLTFLGNCCTLNFMYLELKIFCLLKKKSLNRILQLKRVTIYFVVAYICFIRITNNSFSIQIFNHMYWK